MRWRINPEFAAHGLWITPSDGAGLAIRAARAVRGERGVFRRGSISSISSP
ncbi:hypothetical protein [Sphingomonas soli]|uniref:hypothetical protein n=1 Tax=Sphingomonas soli TaxID=266127 RepID=UPI0012EEB425